MSNTQKTAGQPEIDELAYRHTIGLFATGVTVVACGDGDTLRAAMTANAVTSLSLDPMLLIVCVHKKARLAAQLLADEGFSVNILHQEQQDLSNYFAGGWKEDAPPHYEFVKWQGGPRLKGCAAAIGCEHYQVVEGGDHWIVIGKVVAVHRGDDSQNPLLYYQGHYRALAAEPGYEIPAIWDFQW